MSADGSWRDERIGWPTRILIFFSLFGFFGSDFFLFLLPTVGYWLPTLTFALAIPLLIVFLVAAVRRRWKAVAVLAVTWALMILHLIDVDRAGVASSWLRGQGFRVHAMLNQDYLSRCHLTDFAENGIKQTAGPCESFDWGNYFNVVVYDTTGEFVLPAARRTDAWKQVMTDAALDDVLTKEDRAFHLYGNFYMVGLRPEEFH